MPLLIYLCQKTYINELVANGLDILAIYADMSSGKLGEDYEQHKPALGQVKLEDFAKEFAAAF